MGPAHDRVERRAQLVGERGQELVLGAVRLLGLAARVPLAREERGHDREVAHAGVFVSTHPDVILCLGTKDVLVDTRHFGWGSDCWRIDSLAQLQAALPARLAAGPRVLKQWRGHSGIGIWRIELADHGRVKLRHAQKGAAEEDIAWADAGWEYRGMGRRA